MPEDVSVRVVVFDEVMYHGHGIVAVWMGKITNRFTREAQHYAPVRTGTLRAGIFGEVHPTGARSIEGIIESAAPYSRWVLEGTTGPITRRRFGGVPPPNSEAFRRVTLYRRSDSTWSTNPIPGARTRSMLQGNPGYFMKLKPWPPYKTLYKTSVRGQRANNFLFRAWRATARDHTSIRGIGAPNSIRF